MKADEESVATTSGVGSSSITSVATPESQITWTTMVPDSLQVTYAGTPVTAHDCSFNFRERA
jgi:hypothetical protein